MKKVLNIIKKDLMNNLKLRKQNRELIKKYKTKCKICGESDPCCLEFHHIDKKNFGKGDNSPKQCPS